MAAGSQSPQTRSLRRSALRYERSALHYRSLELLRGAIDSADRGVAVWRPVASDHPAAMARALALRAACLHTRGRVAEATRTADECLEWCARAHGPADAQDLSRASGLLTDAGRDDEAFALVRRVVDEVRAAGTGDLGAALAEYGRQLLRRRGDPGEAAAALREALGHTTRYGAIDIQARRLLLVALARAGRFDELDRQAEEDLLFFVVYARLNLTEHRRYVALLTELVDAGAGTQRPPRRRDFGTLLARERDILRRRQARRALLWRVVGWLLRRVPGARRRRSVDSQQERLAAQSARLEAAVATEAAEVARQRRTGDPRALAEALAVLAKARFGTGGQRSAALTAQRESVELTRQLVRRDAAAGDVALLAERLRLFAEWAEGIGLRSDAQAARAEASALTADQG